MTDLMAYANVRLTEREVSEAIRSTIPVNDERRSLARDVLFR
jgi:hypothetical protein